MKLLRFPGAESLETFCKRVTDAKPVAVMAIVETEDHYEIISHGPANALLLIEIAKHLTMRAALDDTD